MKAEIKEVLEWKKKTWNILQLAILHPNMFVYLIYLIHSAAKCHSMLLHNHIQFGSWCHELMCTAVWVKYGADWPVSVHEAYTLRAHVAVGGQDASGGVDPLAPCRSESISASYALLGPNNILLWIFTPITFNLLHIDIPITQFYTDTVGCSHYVWRLSVIQLMVVLSVLEGTWNSSYSWRLLGLSDERRNVKNN